MVEHYLAKVGVTGSSPASRSRAPEASSAETAEANHQQLAQQPAHYLLLGWSVEPGVESTG